MAFVKKKVDQRTNNWNCWLLRSTQISPSK
jgi:hypothetical protein